ncbi:Ig-like domain repeat protein [Nocardioides ochotonae]|uniref:Ig-like domain repeat protein n=1 Tax=Nocardioides ochotonae TaxID=2685869 RepID=UPI001408F6FF|nr:Ig-like domain repeat protein [Nocardioides ochotonae]
MHSLPHSRRRRALRLGATFALGSALVLSTLGAMPSAQAVPSPSTPAAQDGTGAGEGPDLSDLLAEPTPAPEALELLDRPSLRDVAEHNDLSVAELRHNLATHDTLQVTPQGDLLFVDPAAPAHLRDASTNPDDHDHDIDGDQDQGPEVAAIPRNIDVKDAFNLNSLPGAGATIYLDFDGVEISSSYGSRWQESYGVSGSVPGWDPKNNGAAFNDDEKRAVIEVWQRVAEDFHPFNVNVTTVAPANLLTFPGYHAVITGNQAAHKALCDEGCGGIAYVGVDPSRNQFKPAWTLTRGSGNSAANVAEVTSHEIGHNLGLYHHGKGSTEYYAGHSGWAPIMGDSYGKEHTRWANGAWPDATQPKQDDLAIIRGRLGSRADGGPENWQDARWTRTAAIRGEDGHHETRDIDIFQLGTCQGDVKVRVNIAPKGSNTDTRIGVTNAVGDDVYEHAPTSREDVDTTVKGLPRDTYYLKVMTDARGEYQNDYGVLGYYDWSVTGCDGVPVTTPPLQPTAVTHSFDPATRNLTVTWQPPAENGGHPVTGYTVGEQLGKMPTIRLDASARRHTFTDVPAGDLKVYVNANNALGDGQVAGTTFRSPAPATTTTALTATYGDAARTVSLRTRVTSSTTTAQGTVRVTAGGRELATPVALMGGEATVTVPYEDVLGTELTAEYVPADKRWNPSRTATATTPQTAPSTVRDLALGLDQDTREVTATWRAPEHNGGSAVTAYRVTAGGATHTVAAPATSHTLPAGTGTFGVEVQAVNARGASTPARAELKVPAPTASRTTMTAATRGRTVTLEVTTRSSTDDALVDGQVTVRRGNTPLGTATTTRGVAQLTLTDQPLGRQTYVAVVVPTSKRWSQSSAEASADVMVEPGAPRALTADFEPRDRSARVVWEAPVSDGGTPVTGYRLTLGDLTEEVSGDITEAVLDVEGLAPGEHEVSVVALNAKGASSAATATLVLSPVSDTGVALTSTTLGRAVTLSATVTGDPAPEGSVEFRDGATVLGTVAVTDGVATLQVDRAPLGRRSYTAAFVPADRRWDPATSEAVSATSAKLAASLKVAVTAKTVRLGKRPTVTATLTVRGLTGAATNGPVTVKLGKKTVQARLVDGRAVVRLPKLKKAFFTAKQLRTKAPFKVTYLGNEDVATATLTRKVKVKQ